MEKLIKSQDTLVKDVSSKGLVTLQISRYEKYDYDNDRMLKGAFNKTFKDGKQVHLVNHQVGTSTLVGLPVRKDANNLIIDSQLNLEKTIARELLSDYEFGLKHGRSLQHSQGFIPVIYEENKKGGKDFHEVNMKEYSTVLFGAEADTPVHAIKNAEDAFMLVEKLEKRLKYGFLRDESGKEIERHIQEIKSLLLKPSVDTLQEQKSEAVEDTSHLLMFNFKKSVK